MRGKPLYLALASIPGYALLAYICLAFLKIGAITFGVLSVVVACVFAFWLAGQADAYAKSPNPLTEAEKKAGEEAYQRLLARQRKE